MLHVARILSLLFAMLSISTHVHADESLLKSIDRRIVREPHYDDKPRYVLLALGEKAETLVWLVEDGRKLYVDKNANRDLTDDGPPVAPSEEREWQRTADTNAKSWDFDYVVAEFKPPGAATQKDFRLRRWNYGDSPHDSYGLSLTLDGKVPMYAGWVPYWAASPAKASIIHFGGKLTPRLLRYKQFTLGSHPDRLSVAFVNAGLGEGAKSLLSIDGPDAGIVPILHIEWPTAPGKPPLETTHNLYERCCYWEFYTTDFDVPKDATTGTAKLTIEVPSAFQLLPFATTRFEAPVVAAPPNSTPAK